MALVRIRRARQDEQEVGEAVQGPERERVDAMRLSSNECVALRSPAHRASDVEPRRRDATPWKHEALELGQVRVEPIAVLLESIDLLLSDTEPALVVERHREVRAEI